MKTGQNVRKNIRQKRPRWSQDALKKGVCSLECFQTVFWDTMHGFGDHSHCVTARSQSHKHGQVSRCFGVTHDLVWYSLSKDWRLHQRCIIIHGYLESLITASIWAKSHYLGQATIFTAFMWTFLGILILTYARSLPTEVNHQSTQWRTLPNHFKTSWALSYLTYMQPNLLDRSCVDEYRISPLYSYL